MEVKVNQIKKRHSQIPKIQKRQHPTRKAPIEPRIIKPARMIHRQIRQRIRPRPPLRRRRRTHRHRLSMSRFTPNQTPRKRRTRRQRRRRRRRRTRPRERNTLRRWSPSIRARRPWWYGRPCPLRPAVLPRRHDHILTRWIRIGTSRGPADSTLHPTEDAEVPVIHEEAAFLSDLEFEVGFGEFEALACHEEG